MTDAEINWYGYLCRQRVSEVMPSGPTADEDMPGKKSVSVSSCVELPDGCTEEDISDKMLRVVNAMIDRLADNMNGRDYYWTLPRFITYREKRDIHLNFVMEIYPKGTKEDD